MAADRSTEIARIEAVNVRDVFPHEAGAFTKWLETNIDALTDSLELEIKHREREKTVGDFKVDLYCEDTQGNRIIIENQLEKTNHDHLGKLLTYLVNLEAKVAIWVTPEPRHEHKKVIDWLNDNTPPEIAFYLVKVETIRIGNSPAAPLFTVLAGLNEQAKRFRAAKIGLDEEFVERYALRKRFWQSLLARSAEQTRLGEGKKPTKDHWLTIRTGYGGLNLTYQILKDKGGVELYIDRDDDQALNKRIFDALNAQAPDIEAQIGAKLEWRRLDNKRASRVLWYTTIGDLRREDTWDAVQDEMIAMMIKFHDIFSDYFANLDELKQP